MGSFCFLNLTFSSDSFPPEKETLTSCDFAVSLRFGSFKSREFNPEASHIHSLSSAELPKVYNLIF